MILPTVDSGVRPAGDRDECFHCKHIIGEHREDCVLLKRTIVIKLEIEMVIEEPRSFDPDMIEFHLNESSYCMNNLIRALRDQDERAQERLHAEWPDLPETSGTCTICNRAKATYLREATAEDHEELHYE